GVGRQAAAAAVGRPGAGAGPAATAQEAISPTTAAGARARVPGWAAFMRSPESQLTTPQWVRAYRLILRATRAAVGSISVAVEPQWPSLPSQDVPVGLPAPLARPHLVARAAEDRSRILARNRGRGAHARAVEQRIEILR